MSHTVDLGVGSYPDVAWNSAGYVDVVMGIAPAKRIIVDTNGVQRSEQHRPRAYFPRTNGETCIYSDGELFRLWESNNVLTVDPPHGNNPCDIADDGRMFWQTREGNGPFIVKSVRGYVKDGAPTGIWDANPATPLLWDEMFAGGTRHSHGGVTVKERKDNDGFDGTCDGIAFHLAGTSHVLWPRVATLGERVAIAWCGSGKAWVWVGTKTELRALPLVPEAPQTPPVTPEPDPPQETPKMKFTDNERATLIAFDAKYPVAAIAPTDEDGRRAWLYNLAQTMHARHPGWGTKKQGENYPQSKDSLARWISGTLWGFDTTLGTTPLTLNPNAEGEDITGQVFISVPAFDWLATTPVPPVEPPPVTPGPTPTDVEARLAKVEAFLLTTFKGF